MALSDSARTALNDVAAMDEVSIRDLYKQLKAGWLVAHASGLAVVTWTLPTGVSRTLGLAEAMSALQALQAMIGQDEGGIVFQTAELP
jgi:hypothetical protein